VRCLISDRHPRHGLISVTPKVETSFCSICSGTKVNKIKSGLFLSTYKIAVTVQL